MALFGLAQDLLQIAVPYIFQTLGDVEKPPPVNIQQCFEESKTIRSVIPYEYPRPYTKGRVRVLCVGINYYGMSCSLRGCVNDVYMMMQTFQKLQFPISECCILVDDPRFPNCSGPPTRRNILNFMAWLVRDTKPGDVLFFHYSGHGTQTRATRDSQEKYDQVIVPVDYETAGAILDDDLFKLLVEPLPFGVRMTCLFDCCYSGSMLDLPFTFIGGGNLNQNISSLYMHKIRNDNFSYGDVVMFSGCSDSQTSADISNTTSFNSNVGAGGAATQALAWALLNSRELNVISILLLMRDVLKKKGYKQIPQLSASKPIDLNKTFSLFGLLNIDRQISNSVPTQYYNQRVVGYSPVYPPRQPITYMQPNRPPRVPYPGVVPPTGYHQRIVNPHPFPPPPHPPLRAPVPFPQPGPPPGHPMFQYYTPISHSAIEQNASPVYRPSNQEQSSHPPPESLF